MVFIQINGLHMVNQNSGHQVGPLKTPSQRSEAMAQKNPMVFFSAAIRYGLLRNRSTIEKPYDNG